MSKFRDLSEIPTKYRSIFSQINRFNHVQSEILDDVLKTKKHIVVSAPTGSGKTKIFELAIIELLMSLEPANCETSNVKIIYVAPTKALCNEVFKMWQEKFAAFDVRVGLVTGDSDPNEMTNLNDLQPYQLIVTTPEKWDAMTRKWNDYPNIANAIRLMLIDEIQLLGDLWRGATLEAIVARAKSFSHGDQIRFVSVSASLPNIQDIAKWLAGAEQQPQYDSVRTLRIEEEKRPVKLERQVFGYVSDGNSFLFNRKLTYELPKIVKNILCDPKIGNRQILIFCQTRNDVESSLDQLLKDIQRSIIETKNHCQALTNVAENISDARLKSSIVLGFAFHHAGLSSDDREHVENAYRAGMIRILISTNTLAMGVNLPAHTVIIKSTEKYVNGQTIEMPKSMILQMMGRAGRQQYNSSGRVIIMTKSDKVEYYQNFSTDTTEIESYLSKRLAEFLNVEIVLNTICDSSTSLKQWIRKTFFFVRTTKMMTPQKAEDHLNVCCERAIQHLQQSGLIECKANNAISTLPFGAIMSKYFLAITTMQAFRGFTGNESISNILDKIVFCTEFHEFYLRKNEKTELNNINGGSLSKCIPYRIPSKIITMEQKVSCLLQALISRIPITSIALQMEAEKMLEIAKRMSSSLIEYFQAGQFTKSSFNSVLSATRLTKSLNTRTWWDRQFDHALNPSEQDVNKLKRHGFTTVDGLLTGINPREIEDILKKDIPFGTELIAECAKKLPVYKIYADVKAGQNISIRVTQTNVHYVYEQNRDDGLILLVGDSCNRLIFYDDIQEAMNENGFFEKLVSYTEVAPFLVGFAHVIHQRIVGADKMVQFKLNGTNDDVTSTTVSPPPKLLPQSKPPTRKPFMAINQSTLSRVNVSPMSTMSRSTAAATKATTNTNQSSLSQYFKKVGKAQAAPVPKPKAPPVPKPQAPTKSTFDLKSRVQSSIPIQNVDVRSPNLFSSPSQNTPSPIVAVEKLYDISQVTDSPEIVNNNLLMQANYNQNDKENNEKISPLLIQTPIQSKINVERHHQRNGDANGFICAKSICKKDIPAAKAVAAQPNRLQSMRAAENSTSKQVTDKPMSNMDTSAMIASQCGFDNEILNEIFDAHDDFDISPSTTTHSTTVGLAKTNFRNRSNDDSVLKALNLNIDYSKGKKSIVKDFEDDDDGMSYSSDDDQPNVAHFKLTENRLSFFSPNNARENSETCATVNTSPPRMPLPPSPPPSNNNISKSMQNIINRMPTTSSNYQNHRSVAGMPNINGNTNQLLQPNRPTNTSSQTKQHQHQQQQTVPAKRVATTAQTLALNDFCYVPPHQMQAKVNPQQERQKQMEQQRQQQKTNFFQPDTVEPKRRKLSVEYVLANNGNKYSEKLANLSSSNEPKCGKKIIVPKMSTRNVIGIVGGRLNNNKVNNFDADFHLKQCQERLKTDPNYTEQNFKVDKVRCTVLGMLPNHVQNVQSKNANGANNNKNKPNNDDFDDGDDSCLDDFEDFTTNEFGNDNRYFDRFSPASTMDMMNFSTPESHSSFFY